MVDTVQVLHWGTYIPYTGWYALCRMARPDLDYLPAMLVKNWDKVNCPECKKAKELLDE